MRQLADVLRSDPPLSSIDLDDEGRPKKIWF